MRPQHLVAASALAAALLASAAAEAATAADATTETTDVTAAAPTPAIAPAPTAGDPAVQNDTLRQNADRIQTDTADKRKPWQVIAGWEGHKLIRNNDLGGAAYDKYFNYWFAGGRYDVTHYDRVQLEFGLYQRFLSDPGETGARMDDIVAAYTRFVPLPKEFEMSVRGSLLAPTSFTSFRMGLLTAPSASITLDRPLGKYVNVYGRVGGTYFVQRYNTSRDGTAPNPLARLRFALEGEAIVPQHTPLSFGLGLYTGYSWFHNPTSTMPSLPGAGDPGVAADKTYPHEPMQQSYGGELFARYNLPVPDQMKGVMAFAELAWAQGDPTLGFTSVLHDGVSHFYLFYRQTSEVYASLTVRY